MDEKTEGRPEPQSQGSPVGQEAQAGQVAPGGQGEKPCDGQGDPPQDKTPAAHAAETPPAPSSAPAAPEASPTPVTPDPSPTPATPPPATPVSDSAESAKPAAVEGADATPSAQADDADEKPLPFFLPPIEYEIVEPPEGDDDSDDGFERLHAGPAEEVRFDEDAPRRYGRRGRGRDRRRREEAPAPEPVQTPVVEPTPEKKLPWGLIAAAAAVVVAAAALVIFLLTRGQ